MIAEVLSIFIGILIIGVAWLHYSVNKLHEKASKAHSLATMTYLMIFGLSEILRDKGLISEEDLTGPPKSNL